MWYCIARLAFDQSEKNTKRPLVAILVIKHYKESPISVSCQILFHSTKSFQRMLSPYRLVKKCVLICLILDTVFCLPRNKGEDLNQTRLVELRLILYVFLQLWLLVSNIGLLLYITVLNFTLFYTPLIYYGDFMLFTRCNILSLLGPMRSQNIDIIQNILLRIILIIWFTQH